MQLSSVAWSFEGSSEEAGQAPQRLPPAVVFNFLVLGFRVLGLGFRVKGLRFKVEVKVSGCRITHSYPNTFPLPNQVLTICSD